jgi:hypothetical protein
MTCNRRGGKVDKEARKIGVDGKGNFGQIGAEGVVSLTTPTVLDSPNSTEISSFRNPMGVFEIQSG